ncbi:MAG: restriction endonuclease subunit S [Bacteroides sp.]|nr:restriction endonuclease subunit S [Bacteroides sp.]
MTGKQLRNSILQWAIQGKLVPQDPNDEPASVLLERIRAEKARLVKEKKIKKDKNETIIYRGEDNSYYEKNLATGSVRCIDEEIPFGIPQGWEWERWGNISFSIQYGYNAPALEKGDIRMVRISDIQNGKVIWSKVPYCSIDSSDVDSYLLKPKDILFARTGGTVGKSFLVEEVPYESIYAGYLIRTQYSDELEPHYLKSFMESSLYWEQLKAGTVATAQPNCNGKTLGQMLIPIPPKPEQKRIIDKVVTVLPFLEKYEGLYEAFKHINEEIFHALEKSILQEAIQGKLVPQMESEGTAEDLLTEIRTEKQRLVKEGNLKKSVLANESSIFRGDDNKYYMKSGDEIIDVDERLFEIPMNWRWATLGELIIDSTGLSYRKEDLDDKSAPMVRVLRGGNIEDGIMIFKDDDVQISAKYVPTDLLLTSGTFISPAVSSLEKIGKTALVSQDYSDVVVGGFVLMLTPTFTNNNLHQYLYQFFQSPYYHNYCRSITKKSGQAFYNLSRQKLKQCPVPIPPIKEIPRILEKLNHSLVELSK